MSVQTLGLEINNYVFNGLLKIAFNKTHDSFYSDKAYRHFEMKDPSTESTRLIKSWMDLNESTYDTQYDEEPNPTPLSYFFEGTLFVVESAHQLVKYLQCIDYNIEAKILELTEQDKSDIQFLKDLIIDLLDSIVKNTPEWQNAKWAA